MADEASAYRDMLGEGPVCCLLIQLCNGQRACLLSCCGMLSWSHGRWSVSDRFNEPRARKLADTAGCGSIPEEQVGGQW